LSQKSDIFSGNVLGGTTGVQLTKYIGKRTFSKFLQSFVKKYGNDFYLCSKYIRTASITNNLERHVFMEYLNAFFKLDHYGHNFRCSTGSWSPRRKFYLQKNEKKSILKRLKFCSTSELNRVFSTMINYINSLRKGEHRSFHFVDYDNFKDGTHHKIYSWVTTRGKSFMCSDKKEQERNDNWNIKFSFPEDYSWHDFRDTKDNGYETNGYIR
jgi:hypothetical protein